MGLMPPRLPLGAAPALSVWFRMSENTTTEVLNPGVAALAMLLPITSIHFWNWSVRIPPRTANSTSVSPWIDGK